MGVVKIMKCAVLILCHKNSEQINLLINSLQDDDFDFYIHPDKRMLADKIVKHSNIFIISPEERIKVYWGRISEVDATLKLLRLANKEKRYEYFFLLSGQDLPIKSVKFIKRYIADNIGYNFIDVTKTIHYL